MTQPQTPTPLEHAQRRMNGLGMGGFIAAVAIGIGGLYVTRDAGTGSMAMLERVAVLTPLVIYSAWWLFDALSRSRELAASEQATGADEIAVTALFDAADIAATEVPSPSSSNRPMPDVVSDDIRSEYRSSLVRPNGTVPDELRPGFRDAG